MKTVELNREEFNRRITDTDAGTGQWSFLGDRPALVDFYASWCGPCRSLAPVLDELTEKYQGRVDIYKVNVDQEQELAAAFGVKGVPTLIFIPMDQEPQVIQGALPRERLEEAIESVLIKN